MEAKELTAQGNYQDACPKFQASYKLDKTLGTLLNLADCHEKVGKVASSWAEWGEAVEMARKMGDDRVTFATERRDALTSKLPKLELTVQQPVASLDVYRDGIRVEPAAYNLSLPVDPGEHVVNVRRGDRVLEEKRVTVTEGQVQTLQFNLAQLDAKYPPPKKIQKDTGGTGAAGGGSSSQKTIGYIVGGVGIAGILTGVGLGAVALVKKGQADEADACADGFCANKGLDAAESAKNFAEIGQWVGVGGVVLTAVGATLVFTAPSSEGSASRQRGIAAAPWLGPTGGGVFIQGAL